jgi:NTP pyrophosphatase (non-canonical NTP hydrolase)
VSLYDPDLAVGSKLERVLILVGSERMRQDILKEQGRFEFSCADDGLTNAEKLACLTEELGEVAQEVLTQEGRRLARDTVGTKEALRKELVQVAAVAVAWIEGLDREGERVVTVPSERDLGQELRAAALVARNSTNFLDEGELAEDAVADAEMMEASAQRLGELAAEVDQLREALERAEWTIDLLVAQKPVRDLAETRAEITAALVASRAGLLPDPAYTDLATPITEGLLSHRPGQEQETT